MSFVKNEYLGYFSKVVTKISEEEDSKELIHIINRFDYLFQIHDSVNDLFATKKIVNEHFIELKSDIILLIRELSSQSLNLFDDIYKSISNKEHLDINKKARQLQAHLDDANKDILVLLADPMRKDAGAMVNFATYSQRLKDKLVNFFVLGQAKENEKST
jgi:phosphate:Na+ symporter